MFEQGHSLLFAERAVVLLLSVHVSGNVVGDSKFFHVLEFVFEVDLRLLVVSQVGYVCAAEWTTDNFALKYLLSGRSFSWGLNSRDFFLLGLSFAMAVFALT